MPHFLVTVSPREQTAEPEVVHTLYLLSGPQLAPADVARMAAELLHDPVVQRAEWRGLSAESLSAEGLGAGAASVVELAYRPGVTDNPGESAAEGARRLGVDTVAQARALSRHLLPPGADPQARAKDLAIDLVQTALVYRPGDDPAARLAFYAALVAPPEPAEMTIARVPLRQADDDELLRISRAGVLALDLDEMRAVRGYFAQLGRDPSDGELETIAQTWSEHCSHKTFKAKVRYRAMLNDELGMVNGRAAPDPALYPAYHLLRQDVEIDSLIKTFLISATDRIIRQSPDQPQFNIQHSTFNIPSDSWVLSAFVDNAGIIAFGEAHEVSFKVETHNHPSALEPFGGANTGVGGVIRDVLGVSARPIANTDVLCFGPPEDRAPAGVLSPQRIAAGVVAGVRDYGNKLGIPTVNGAVLFDPGYTANPLVYCGTLGIAPRGSNPHNIQPGDAVVVMGGRTGRDGIHGATFSSIELTHSTAAEVGSAVQIGDPITEKKLLDVLLQARDLGLYSGITDCGAGGLSSAVGEMGAETGVSVELEHAPLKYAGLQPWEVWLSEAQERMVLAVPPASLDALLALCAGEDVEACAIGHFTDDGRLRVAHAGQTLVDIDMAFLHDGRPQRVLEAVWTPLQIADCRLQIAEPNLQSAICNLQLLALLAHPNIASKERIVRSYDHEVGGATVIKPLVGERSDGPGDAAVLQPLPRSLEGLALGCGINPRYGQIDPYWMALASVDEALRNVVAVGGDPGRTGILDNFCWGDPRQPDRMAGLTRAAAGCYDAAVAFGTPFVSGKDSLNNEYRDASGQRVAIPPTLLISALANVPDVRRCVTMDLKVVGNRVYLVGATREELAGSHLAAIGVEVGASELPKVDLAAARETFARMHAAISAGVVRACHDLSEGGLAVAAAEMAMAGGLGLDLDIALIGGEASQLARLFGETPSRFLAEVAPEQAAAFESHMAGVELAALGEVTGGPELHLRAGEMSLARIGLAELKAAWQSGLDPLEL
ncbi:phosphoribosylformylglycinamidine synthase subunit PurL [Oscillochloris sp. ZM17-4]|uniref:phosphoribosylformylglycinamidine synthase subunit PurL n=1 Tax=Oscillochloris sp. ZM17-4 TaxID=2866714 RepID=UPI001C735EBE|nr:phosphoribosylformylglycinamidine synthase subunit PurL [Oscillochloris sp. ZM17-4]MBX0327973.1 phosphoribosylformylglycinamidine synthase subunit PurL [Oscillochloris sp. ZM17-4]